MRAATHRCRASARRPFQTQAGDLKAAAGAANAQWPRLAPRDMTAVRGSIGSIGSNGSNGSNGSSLSAAGHGGGLDALPRPCGAQATANYSRRKRDGDLHRHPRPACVHPASALRMRVDGVDARPVGPMANQHEANHSSSVPPIALATIALRIPDTGHVAVGECHRCGNRFLDVHQDLADRWSGEAGSRVVSGARSDSADLVLPAEATRLRLPPLQWRGTPLDECARSPSVRKLSPSLQSLRTSGMARRLSAS